MVREWWRVGWVGGHTAASTVPLFDETGLPRNVTDGSPAFAGASVAVEAAARRATGEHERGHDVFYGGKDETSPLSTGGRTRRARLVRGKDETCPVSTGGAGTHARMRGSKL